MQPTPKITKPTFWDVDIEKINFNQHAEWVITRVFDRGNLNEVYEIIKYYGFVRVKNTLITTEINMPEHAIDLAKVFFHLKNNDFKCLKKKQSPYN